MGGCSLETALALRPRPSGVRAGSGGATGALVLRCSPSFPRGGGNSATDAPFEIKVDTVIVTHFFTMRESR